MSGVFRWLAVNTRVHTCYQYAHTRLRVHRAPGIPHALCFQGGSFWQTSGVSRREIAKVCHSVIASEAKQSMEQKESWIASLRSQ
jgi:hypothetical protein